MLDRIVLIIPQQIVGACIHLIVLSLRTSTNQPFSALLVVHNI